MKSMKTMAVAMAMAWAGAACAYNSVEELVVDFKTRENAALKEYMEQHPQAPDLREARGRLIYGYRMLGQDELAMPLMQKEYDEYAARPTEVDLGAVMGTVRGMLNVYVDRSQRAEGHAFVAKVKADFAKNAEAELFAKSLDQVARILARPIVGDKVEVKFKAIDGRDVDTAAMTNKLILVDFWATWCGPCRGEIPHVKAAYEKYHDKGFEVVAISMDEEREKLDAFIKEQGLPWPQAFDGKGMGGELAERYYIGTRGIPATFLIGGDGKVIAKDLRGEQLGQKLAELLK